MCAYPTCEKSNEWETPQELFDELNAEFRFTLDPCATEKTAKCKKFYSYIVDGWKQPWDHERVFMNPPYGKNIINWVAKALNETTEKECEIVVGLLPVRTDTIWFHKFVYGHTELRFIKGRVKFVKDGKTGPAPFPSMIAIWRNNKMLEAFL